LDEFKRGNFDFVFPGNNENGGSIDSLIFIKVSVNDVKVIDGTSDELFGGISEFNEFPSAVFSSKRSHDLGVDNSEDQFVDGVVFEIESVGFSSSNDGWFVSGSLGEFFIDLDNFANVFPRNKDDLDGESSFEIKTGMFERDIESVDGSSDDLGKNVRDFANFETFGDEFLNFFKVSNCGLVNFEIISVVHEVEISGGLASVDLTLSYVILDGVVTVEFLDLGNLGETFPDFDPDGNFEVFSLLSLINIGNNEVVFLSGNHLDFEGFDLSESESFDFHRGFNVVQDGFLGKRVFLVIFRVESV
jgi:hypothetical protein